MAFLYFFALLKLFGQILFTVLVSSEPVADNEAMLIFAVNSNGDTSGGMYFFSSSVIGGWY